MVSRRVLNHTSFPVLYGKALSDLAAGSLAYLAVEHMPRGWISRKAQDEMDRGLIDPNL